MAEKEWPPKEEFADRFARLRRHKKLENAQIAGATGVKPKTVSMWAGGQEPKGAALLALAELLEVTPQYLLKGEPEDLKVGKSGSRAISHRDLAKPSTKRRA